MVKTYTYTVRIELAEEGGFNVFVPALPGCHTQGETYEEALAMAHEAILCYIEGLQKTGESIPIESHRKPSPTVNVGVKMESTAAA